MKKTVSILLALVLMLSCMSTVFAVDKSREYLFELSVDGSDTVQAQTGDIITVVFNLYRTDSKDAADMYAMQNEIRYDSKFFELVEGSELLSNGIVTKDLAMRDDYREFYMNFVSMSGGESWEAERMVGSFQLKVIAESGATRITNEDYLVSTVDGNDSYQATCQDISVVVSTDCRVKFESNGGTKVEDQTVVYGELVEKPKDPVRDGYELVDWCSDLDLQNPWDFDKDPVKGNMTLYAKWQKEGLNESVKTGDPNHGTLIWVAVAFVAALIALIALLLMNQKTVQFDTGCRAAVPAQKVRKGKLVSRPADPRQLGKTFAGWYRDADCQERWDFETEKVTESMTLYAKWI